MKEIHVSGLSRKGSDAFTNWEGVGGTGFGGEIKSLKRDV